MFFSRPRPGYLIPASLLALLLCGAVLVVQQGGGRRPKTEKAHARYRTVESHDYLEPDTTEEDCIFRSMTPSKRAWRRAFIGFVYAVVGVMSSVVMTGVIGVGGVIEKARVKATVTQLQSENAEGGRGDIGSAWLVWTGSSLVLCMGAVACVLVCPAAGSSGIPGVIAHVKQTQQLVR